MPDKILGYFKTIAHNIRVYFFWSIFGLGLSGLSTGIFALASEPYILKITPSPFGFALVNEEFYRDEMRARLSFEAVKTKPKPAASRHTPVPTVTPTPRRALSIEK